MTIIFLGPPGSGKGTQAKLLVKRFDLVYVATGDILRSAVQNKTPLGVEAEQYMAAGKLVPDTVILRMIESTLNNVDISEGIVLDGFPRSLAQGEALLAFWQDRHWTVDHLLYLNVDREELVRRLMQRAIEQNRVDDQKEDVIRARIHEYMEKTLPLVDFFRKMNILRELQGIGEVQEIHEAIVRQLGLGA